MLAVDLVKTGGGVALALQSRGSGFFFMEKTRPYGRAYSTWKWAMCWHSSRRTAWRHPVSEPGSLDEVARAALWKATAPGAGRPVERTFRDGHRERWWALEIKAGPYGGPRRRERAVVVTTDPATLPELSTWYLVTNPPARNKPRATTGPRVAASLAEVVRLYGLRAWVEQSYKQVKTTLGWAQYQVRSSRAIQRHWILVYCAFTFCWWQAAQPSGADAWAGVSGAATQLSANARRAASTKKVPPRPWPNPSYRGPPRCGRCAVGWSRPSCSNAIGAASRCCPRRPCFKIYLIGCGAARGSMSIPRHDRRQQTTAIQSNQSFFNRQASGMNEGEQQVRSLPKARKSAIDELAHVLPTRWGDIGQPLLDIAVAKFFRIKFRRIFGQWLHDNLGMIEKVAQGDFTRMNAGMITDQHKAFRHVVAQVLQGGDHVLAIHATLKMAFVDFAKRSDLRRSSTPVDHGYPASWLLAARSPGTPEPFEKREAELIIKHDVYAAPPRLFLSAANPAPAKRG